MTWERLQQLGDIPCARDGHTLRSVKAGLSFLLIITSIGIWIQLLPCHIMKCSPQLGSLLEYKTVFLFLFLILIQWLMLMVWFNFFQLGLKTRRFEKQLNWRKFEPQQRCNIYTIQTICLWQLIIIWLLLTLPSALGSVLYLFGGSNYPESEECLEGLYAYDIGKTLL